MSCWRWSGRGLRDARSVVRFFKRLHAVDVNLQPIGTDGQFRVLYLPLFQLREQFMRAPAHDAHLLAMHPPSSPTRSASLTSEK
jgi:hypothetical protein